MKGKAKLVSKTCIWLRPLENKKASSDNFLLIPTRETKQYSFQQVEEKVRNTGAIRSHPILVAVDPSAKSLTFCCLVEAPVFAKKLKSKDPLPNSSQAISRPKRTWLLSPPLPGSPHVTTEPSMRMAAKALSVDWIAWTCVSCFPTWRLQTSSCSHRCPFWDK